MGSSSRTASIRLAWHRSDSASLRRDCALVPSREPAGAQRPDPAAGNRGIPRPPATQGSPAAKNKTSIAAGDERGDVDQESRHPEAARVGEIRAGPFRRELFLVTPQTLI